MAQLHFGLCRPPSAGCIGDPMASWCPALDCERSGHESKEITS